MGGEICPGLGRNLRRPSEDTEPECASEKPLLAVRACDGVERREEPEL